MNASFMDVDLESYINLESRKVTRRLGRCECASGEENLLTPSEDMNTWHVFGQLRTLRSETDSKTCGEKSTMIGR